MNANQKSRLTTAAEIAAIVGTVITCLALAYAIGWWPFPKDTAKIAGENPTVTKNAPTATFTPTSTNTPRPVATPTLGIGSTKISPIGGAMMVYVPAGAFMMGTNDGNSDEKPPHLVYLDAFWIDRFEITNELYKKCVVIGVCKPPNQTRSNGRELYYGNSQYDNYPVINVSWENAKVFCAWAGKHLPSEAQWEKSARGIDGRLYPWGNNFDKSFLNSVESRKEDTVAVGINTGGTSPYSAMDMAGNVWEWIADSYTADYYKNSPSRNPLYENTEGNRGLRGGSWKGDFYDVRVSKRGNDSPTHWSNILGFRCAE